MRKGQNLSKDILIQKDNCSHRIIIPLFIPNEQGYYLQSFQIFEYTVFSILKTSKSNVKISVISNGSCDTVNDKLFKLYADGTINELVIEKDKIGKINSILKVLRTTDERLITITDADVLFLDNWEDEVINIFKKFPMAGSVSPVPVFRTHSRLTGNIWMKYFFSKRLYFSDVPNKEAMTKFANSIGWPWLDIKFKDVFAVLESKDGTNKAVLGSSHFVLTYKREVFEQLPKINSLYILGGDSEFLYTDEPVLKMGGYRFSTYENYAYHMGNTIESWMVDMFNNLKERKKEDIRTEEFKLLRKRLVSHIYFDKIFKFLIYFKFIHTIVLKFKGLNNKQISYFVE